MSAPNVIVRELDSSDLEAVVELTNLRFGHKYSIAAIQHAVYGSEDSTVRNWIAFVDNQPVGLTGWVFHELKFHSRTYKAGYWQHLFVHPDYRRLMIYPQLVFAMQKGAQEFGLDFIYNANRRLEVWQSHIKLGFSKIGEYPVLIKPIRPLSLVIKSKNLPNIFNILSFITDNFYTAFITLKNFLLFNKKILFSEARDWSINDFEGFIELIDKTSGADQVNRLLSPEEIRSRYSMNLEEDPYQILYTRDSKGDLSSILVFRKGLRGNGISVCVVMDFMFTESCKHDAKAMLNRVEKYAVESGCEAILYLDGVREPTRRIVRKSGYFKSPENYVMILWNNKDEKLNNALDWRFSFANHDAF